MDYYIVDPRTDPGLKPISTHPDKTPRGSVHTSSGRQPLWSRARAPATVHAGPLALIVLSEVADGDSGRAADREGSQHREADAFRHEHVHRLWYGHGRRLRQRAVNAALVCWRLLSMHLYATSMFVKLCLFEGMCYLFYFRCVGLGSQRESDRRYVSA